MTFFMTLAFVLGLAVSAVVIGCGRALASLVLPSWEPDRDGFSEEEDDRDGDDDHVSTATRRAIERRELTRGVDLPTWRTPREIEAMTNHDRRHP